MTKHKLEGAVMREKKGTEKQRAGWKEYTHSFLSTRALIGLARCLRACRRMKSVRGRGRVREKQMTTKSRHNREKEK